MPVREQLEFFGLLSGMSKAQAADETTRVLTMVHGRDRAIRWGDRTLDLDIIAFGDLEQDDPDLLLPHPRAHERVFVLEPWIAVDPDAVLPGRGRVVDLLDALQSEEGL